MVRHKEWNQEAATPLVPRGRPERRLRNCLESGAVLTATPRQSSTHLVCPTLGCQPGLHLHPTAQANLSRRCQASATAAPATGPAPQGQ
jgi:hypothetical protein